MITNFRSPWRNIAEAAEHLRFTRRDGSLDLRATREYIDRWIAVKDTRRRGRAILVHIDALDASLRRRA